MEFCFEYLKNPHYLKQTRIDWSYFFKVLILFYVLSLPLVFFSGATIKVLLLKESKFNYGIIKTLITGILLAPFVEELLFRLLLRPLIRNIVVITALLTWMIVNSILKEKSVYMLILFPVILYLCFLCFNKGYLRRTQRFFLQNFRYLFYMSCIVFASIHIFNFEAVSFKMIFLWPLIVLPQLFGGSVLGYIRMKFGFFYSFLFHSMINFFPVILFVKDM